MKNLLIVSHCILNNAAKVEQDEAELAEEYKIREELMQLILKKDVQLLQLPCPEFIMYGSQRWGHVKNQFQHPFYMEQCRKILEPVLLQLQEYAQHVEKFHVLGIVSVEGSPNCGYHLTCDAGRFNDDIFVYIAAFGLFTDVSYQTKQSMKNVLGHLAYVLEGAKRLFNIPSYKVKVTHDDEVIEDEFVYGMVTNSRSVGGFRNLVGKQVGFDDGVFEVTLIKTPKNPIELQEIIAALMIQQMDSKYMYTFKSGRIMFESIEEIPWTLDGEFGGEHDEVVIENLNKELQIMVPGTHEED